MLYQLGVLLAIATYAFANAVEEPCYCELIYAPVCGSDGHTYSNLCVLKCEQLIHRALRHLHPGKCLANECFCTLEYNPVCGLDHVTYPNLCSLECDGVKLAHNGEC